MSKTAAPQAAQSRELREMWCEECGEPVMAGAHAKGLVVHAGTDEIFCANGAVAPPTGDRRVAAEAADRASLQRDYPGWQIWRSNGGRWWATRLESRPPQPRSLDADTAAALRAQLPADSVRRAHGGNVNRPTVATTS